MRGYRISAAAEGDLVAITAYTLEHFGELALDRYLRLIEVGIDDLCDEPERHGVREFENGILSYPIRFSRDRAMTETGGVKSPRHLIYFRLGDDGWLEIVRVLHDSMDPERQMEA